MADLVTCEYCSEEQDRAKRCKSCGAPLPENMLERYSPFYSHGYMIWPEKDWSRDEMIFHIWLGDKRVHVVVVSRRDIDKFVSVGEDPSSFIWDMIKLALGEKEVLRIEEQNKRNPVMYEIRTIVPAIEWPPTPITQDIIDDMGPDTGYVHRKVMESMK